MHILFIHRQFPAQFGQIARHLVQHHGWECTFVCEQLPTNVEGFGAVRYLPDFAAGVQIGAAAPASSSQDFSFSFTPQSLAQEPAPADDLIEGIRVLRYQFHEASASLFDNLILRGQAVYETLKSRPDIQPDLVVGPPIYASALFLPDLYACPVVNYFDYYYRGDASYLGFRPEFPPAELDILRARAHNALVLLDWRGCVAGYSPTQWQRSLFPEDCQHKIATIFDGIDRSFWYRRSVPRRIGNGPLLPPDTRIVTYVARGLEALRGFDIFMKVAKRICEVRSDVVFVVVGSEHFYHGPDLNYIQAKSFLEHVLLQDHYDLNRFIFAGRVPSAQLVEILSLSDLHIYLTAPFVLSWSLFDALACGCTVLASDTAPVREVIQHEKTGLLAGFFDIERLTELALRVLDEPRHFDFLAQAGVDLIDDKYSLTKTMPQILALFQRSVHQS